MTRVTGLRRQAAAAAVAALAVASLAACGQSAQATTCGHYDGVRSAIENLRDVNLSENGMVALESGLAQVKNELQLLKGDVAAGVQPQVEALYTSVQQLKASATDAKLHPSAAALSAVGNGLQSVRSSVKELGGAVAATC
jgi:hypothetical protein